ncbi:DUF1566 domain-containing protein [Oceanospirillum sp. D5]|uniref:DUF1566 domain-containing protein n=1 Tax=Oceanospirillum sediminis TaxID=2760088 RepID=A0A839IYA0_9GAMM|nr:DUF1566 domain-containing protein [Oceanospirillum sediminis]
MSATCNTGSIPLTTEAGVRFILHDATAFDTKTGLTWLRCSAGTYWDANAGCVGDVKIMSLTQAELYAANTGTDWRVPTIQELYSIVDINSTNPAIRSDIFPDIKNLSEGAPYWSDSEVEGLPSLFYYIDFIDGSVDGHSNGFPLAVRLVRSGR